MAQLTHQTALQAVRSLAGRLAPRVALLDPTLLDRHVTQRVLRWAALGGGNAAAGGTGSQAVSGAGGVADVSALLAEDAAEVSRERGRFALAWSHGQNFDLSAGWSSMRGLPATA